MSDSSPLSKRLKQAREAIGLSQKQLGIKAGIDEFSASARMNQYETGKHTPDFLTLKQIAKILKLPLPYFYADDETLAQTLYLYNQLSKKEKDDLLIYINRKLTP